MKYLRVLTALSIMAIVTSCEQEDGTNPENPNEVAREAEPNPGCKVSSVSTIQETEVFDSNDEITRSYRNLIDFNYRYDGNGLLSERIRNSSVNGQDPLYEREEYIRSELGLIQSVQSHRDTGIGIREFERSGNSISIETYGPDGTLFSTYVYEVTDGHITKRTINVQDLNGSDYVLLESIYTWNEGNLTQRVTTVYRDDASGLVNYVHTFNFHYDDKFNPDAYTWSEHHFQNSKNNVIRTERTMQGAQGNILATFDIEHEYTYNDDGYPITANWAFEQSLNGTREVFRSETTYSYDSCN